MVESGKGAVGWWLSSCAQGSWALENSFINSKFQNLIFLLLKSEFDVYFDFRGMQCSWVEPDSPAGSQELPWHRYLDIWWHRCLDIWWHRYLMAQVFRYLMGQIFDGTCVQIFDGTGVQIFDGTCRLWVLIVDGWRLLMAVEWENIQTQTLPLLLPLVANIQTQIFIKYSHKYSDTDSSPPSAPGGKWPAFFLLF